MDNTSLLKNSKYISYDYQQEKTELMEILQQAREINEIQSELACLIDIQDVDICAIDESVQETYNISHSANIHLESASGKKFKFTPILIGGAMGGILTLPFTISAVAAGTVSSALVGYIAGGGAIFGGVIGKKLS
jgi:hypothetical protein|tara:strand:- start:42 stop:446 length:405 start_codon:yes stop_codon:yes gene_type:complete